MKDDSVHGQAMLALNESQRAFVLELLDQADTNYTRAYMIAFPDASRLTAKANGHKLAHDPRVLEALHEEAGNRLRASAVMGASVLRQIANDPTHKDQLKAATTLLNRIGLHERTEHKVTVERPTDDVEIIQRIVDLGKSLGLSDETIKGMIGNNVAAPAGLLAAPSAENAAVIDAEFAEIGTTEGLEGVL